MRIGLEIAVEKFVVMHELLNSCRRIVRGVVTANVRVVECVAAELPDLRRVPTISPQQRLSYSELPRLLCNDRNVSVVAGNINDVGTRSANRAELAAIILISLSVGLLAHHQPAEL